MVNKTLMPHPNILIIFMGKKIGAGNYTMIKGNALRHQMVLPEQKTVYDYWRSKCRDGRFPRRADISPNDLVPFLPTISFIEANALKQANRYKVRLAGTGFWTHYGQEITGCYIEQLPIGERREYWNRVLNQVVDSRKPTAGVTRPGTPRSAHMAQFWIRLPLSENGTDINLILGFDQFIKVSEVENSSQDSEKIFA